MIGGSPIRYDPDGHVELVYEGIGVSNGIGFSPDNKIMCKCRRVLVGACLGSCVLKLLGGHVDYIDSPTRVIYQMDFDLVSF
jgi:hypothetical protein